MEYAVYAFLQKFSSKKISKEKLEEIIVVVQGSFEAKQSLDEKEKYDLLIQAMEHLNLTYEDKVYFDESMSSEDLSEVIELKLIDILERGVFVK